MTDEVLNQHVTDPESCIQCSACEMACPKRAIENIAGRYCVDFARCKNCGACIKDCPTGAADRFVQITTPYSQLEQAQWSQLPKDRQKPPGNLK